VAKNKVKKSAAWSGDELYFYFIFYSLPFMLLIYALLFMLYAFVAALHASASPTLSAAHARPG
jgi:hypothetical protein